MKEFAITDVGHLLSTFEDIVQLALKEGDEQILYELNFALEFRPSSGKVFGRGIVTFGLSGIGEPTCYASL